MSNSHIDVVAIKKCDSYSSEINTSKGLYAHCNFFKFVTQSVSSDSVEIKKPIQVHQSIKESPIQAEINLQESRVALADSKKKSSLASRTPSSSTYMLPSRELQSFVGIPGGSNGKYSRKSTKEPPVKKVPYSSGMLMKWP